MKKKLKKTVLVATGVIMAAILIIVGCHKDSTTPPSTNTSTPSNTDNYSSMAAFFAKNGVAMQVYTVNGAKGGSFTTQQGTIVTIPANTFMNSNFQTVSGTVTIDFKDIYKKSDMLLSNMATNELAGPPLKSGGEFFIKATSGGNAVLLGNIITIKQPFNSMPADSNMGVFGLVKVNDSLAGWVKKDSIGYIQPAAASYVFSLYEFQQPADSGSWCNSDNPSYFAAYTQSNLTLTETDNPSNYDTYVFLVFKNINCMVHVYNGSGYSFPYNYAPVGLQCTVVAVGVKGGTVYSSFTPITISANQIVTFSMSATTTAEFESALTALN